jgi:Copper type II ascorbate-dependent monooxygenase, N-terminal domain/Copper type II ascorbate-dependent monooxygenase, C-terminal domain
MTTGKLTALTALPLLLPLLLSISLSLPACSDSAPPDDELGTATYYQDVKPILDAKCVTCHSTGGIAPFPLSDYTSAAEHAAISAGAVRSKIMPPWPANGDCRDYDGERSLEPAQIETLERWAQQGAPEGDPATPGAPLASAIPTLSRVDRRLEMPEAYTLSPPPGSEDDYRCFVLPWPTEYTQRTHVTGFRAVPGNAELVHHVIAFLAAPSQVAQVRSLDAADPRPGYSCFGGAGAPVSGMIGAWAPGSLGADLPAGVGLPVEPGSAIVLQLHYHGHGGAGSDRSAIEFKLDSTIERPGRITPFTNPQWPRGAMTIPANQADVVHSFTVDPTFLTGELEIFSSSLHMHTLGTSGKLAIQRADGTKSCLLQIDDWDFHWQGSYTFSQPETLRRGDQLSIECRWDNTAGNQPLINGVPKTPADVTWGEGTSDEMCIGFFLTAAPR